MVSFKCRLLPNKILLQPVLKGIGRYTEPLESTIMFLVERCTSENKSRYWLSIMYIGILKSTLRQWGIVWVINQLIYARRQVHWDVKYIEGSVTTSGAGQNVFWDTSVFIYSLGSTMRLHKYMETQKFTDQLIEPYRHQLHPLREGTLVQRTSGSVCIRVPFTKLAFAW